MRLVVETLMEAGIYGSVVDLSKTITATLPTRPP